MVELENLIFGEGKDGSKVKEKNPPILCLMMMIFKGKKALILFCVCLYFFS